MTRNFQNAYVLSDGIAAQEIASVERYLCKSTTESTRIRFDPNGVARIQFKTPTPNENSRASITASLVTAIAETDEWAVDQILDPLEDTQHGITVSWVEITLTE